MLYPDSRVRRALVLSVCLMCLISSMGLCMDLRARAARFIAFLWVSRVLQVLCVFFRFLLIFDIESALSAASAAVGAVGACCLLVCGARRVFRVLSRVSRRQSGEVGVHVTHVGRWRWVGGAK
jgi:hypothetical protein